MLRAHLHHAALASILSLLAACAAPPAPPAIPPAPVAAIAPEPDPEPEPEPDPDPEPLVAAIAPAPAPPPPALPAPAPRAQVRAVVLVYHMLGSMESEMAVEPAAFEEQMRFLVDHGVPVVRTSELASFLEGARPMPERVAVIQLDDGHVSVRSRAFPVLARLGLPFTIALNTAALEEHRREAMTWDAVREMLASGLCEIASHSHIHGHMERLTDARNRSEAELSRTVIEARTGVHPEAFVYPFGGHDERVRQTIEDAGYRLAFGVSGVPARADSPRFDVPRVGVMRGTTIGAFGRLFGVRPAEARKAAAGAKKSG
jgi:peptidoglycan/xylan/chitin deacetylase (PgdA/CDA1 family)